MHYVTNNRFFLIKEYKAPQMQKQTIDKIEIFVTRSCNEKRGKLKRWPFKENEKTERERETKRERGKEKKEKHKRKSSYFLWFTESKLKVK